MSYKQNTPNGKLYLGHVKWSNDYKHVMLFSSESARNAFMTSHLSLVKSNVIYYNPNRYIDVGKKLEDLETKNYAFYINDSDISDTKYCCFITNYEYIAPNTTRIYIELDVFQMYHYSTTYYQSFIERGIVSSAQNIANTNYLPEPITAPLEYEKEIKTILNESDWQPVWVLHSASFYNSTTNKYEYEGIGTSNTFGEYGRFIDGKTELKKLLEMYGRKSVEEIADDVGQASGNTTWKDWLNSIFAGTAGTEIVESVKATTSAADLQDHRDELIGLYAIPKWLKDTFDGDANYADNRRVLTNDIPLTIDNSKLANGYTPRNKKLLTSVCRGYALINRTGLRIPFKPELFTGEPSITLHGITMSTAGYQYTINGYADLTITRGEVPYSSERRVGYDANTGINKALSVINAGTELVGSATGLAGNIASGNAVGSVIAGGNLVSAGVSAIDQIGQREQHFGNNGDLLRITGTRPILRWIEISPTRSQCEAIDSFMDMYGYTIQKHQNPTNYFNSRTYWNYVKCSDNVNLTCQAPADYENKLKSILAAGVTLWHDYSNFGDYSQNNS